MFPRILINKYKFEHNLNHILELCHSRNITLMAVTKVFCADNELVQIIHNSKTDYIADSRLENLKSMETDKQKVLLRLPMISEASAVVDTVDISQNSELKTIRELNHVAHHLQKNHGIILMIDLGDLREGIFDENEVFSTVDEVLQLHHITLKGIGVNLTCYGGVLPTPKILERLIEYKTKIEKKYNIILDIISGGNSSSIELLLQNKIPNEINNLRIGEAIVLGRETAYGDYIDNTYNDVFVLEAEIIELKEKPSVPIGETGMNAFGKIVTFEDKGTQKRAILAIGKQDVDSVELIPIDDIEILGQSSDHTIVDLTNSNVDYQVGDIIKFELTYGSILSLMTSKYVHKEYI